MSDASSHSRADLIPLVAWAAGFIALAVLRASWQAIPQDTSAYLAAADLVTQGHNPYTQIELSPLYQGFPYLYYPGLAPLLRVCAVLPIGVILVVDTLLRGVAGAWIMRALVKRTGVELPWQGLMLGWLCLDPFVTDLYVGNLELFMCAMWLGVLYLAESRHGAGVRAASIAFVVGVLMVAKPMWGIPTVYVAALKRRWDIVAGLAVGAGSVLLAGWVLYAEQIPEWWAIIGAARDYWRVFDLGSAHPALVVVAAGAWAVMGFELWRKQRADAWLWAASSLLVWPRLGTYCYVLALPLLLWSLGRHGKLVGLCCALPFSLAISFIWPDDAVLRLCIMYVALLGLSAAWLLDGKSTKRGAREESTSSHTQDVA